REKIERLENKTDFSISNRGQFVIVHFRDVFPIEFIAPGSRGIQTTKHVHQRRLSAAARAHDGDVFVLMNLQRHSAQRAHGLFAHHVILGDVFDVDDELTNCALLPFFNNTTFASFSRSSFWVAFSRRSFTRSALLSPLSRCAIFCFFFSISSGLKLLSPVRIVTACIGTATTSFTISVSISAVQLSPGLNRTS